MKFAFPAKVIDQSCLPDVDVVPSYLNAQGYNLILLQATVKIRINFSPYGQYRGDESAGPDGPK